MRRVSHAVVLGVLLLGALIGGNLATVRSSAAYPAAPLAQPPEVTIRGIDYAFVAPAQIEAGLVTITLVNEGAEPHQANIGRIQDGKTFDDLTAALGQSEAAGLALLEFVGGPNTIPPGGRQQVTINVREGLYALLCFVPSPDGTPHIAKGMIKPLQVVAPPSQQLAPEPQTGANATMRDFSFTLPSPVQAGSYTWKITNEGPQPHELTLIQLPPGKTLQDVTAFLQSPAGSPPYQDAGGIGAMAAGKSGWAKLDLQAGTYAALCFVPDPASGKPHFALGMLSEFRVAAAGPASMPATGGTSYARLSMWLAAIAGGGVITGWVLQRKARRV
jgi:hypothetical protein